MDKTKFFKTVTDIKCDNNLPQDILYTLNYKKCLTYLTYAKEWNETNSDKKIIVDYYSHMQIVFLPCIVVVQCKL